MSLLTVGTLRTPDIEKVRALAAEATINANDAAESARAQAAEASKSSVGVALGFAFLMEN